MAKLNLDPEDFDELGDDAQLLAEAEAHRLKRLRAMLNEEAASCNLDDDEGCVSCSG
jgi:hypothetical protein